MKWLCLSLWLHYWHRATAKVSVYTVINNLDDKTDGIIHLLVVKFDAMNDSVKHKSLEIK